MSEIRENEQAMHKRKEEEGNRHQHKKPISLRQATVSREVKAPATARLQNMTSAGETAEGVVRNEVCHNNCPIKPSCSSAQNPAAKCEKCDF